MAKKMEAALEEEKEVNRLLLLAGYKKVELKKLSKCARAGLIRGNFGFKFTGDPSQLDTVVREGNCKEFGYEEDCDGILKATVRDLLQQNDYGGDDYENNSEEASVKCELCDQGQYLTNCCNSKKPDWDSGKFHNHCKKCPGLGKCLGDYREAHCSRCGGHYYAGAGGKCGCPKGAARGGKAGRGAGSRGGRGAGTSGARGGARKAGK